MTLKALNRALLARQILLRREGVPALEAVERLVGLQAQQARPPFAGLWSRVAGFEREELLALLQERRVVRGTMLRCTLHLVSAADYLRFRPVLQPVLTGAMTAVLKERVASFDLPAMLLEARRLLSERPRTFGELRGELLKSFPDADERAMGYAVRTQLPLVGAPGSGDWGFRPDSEFALADEWLESTLEGGAAVQDLVLRYLAAFGPAAPKDFETWSYLPNAKPIFEELRPRLVTFRDERKRELFDLPDAPRPDEETAAPVRFVAEFDNLILAHADRRRIIADEHRRVVVTKNLQVLGTFLVDGFVAGTWKASRVRRTAVITVSPFAALPTGQLAEIYEEGGRLARFLEPDAAGFEVRFP